MGVVTEPLERADMARRGRSLLLLLTVSLAVTSSASASLIKESPQSTTAVSGSPVTLSCRLQDTSSRYNIEWYKDSEVLDTTNSPHRLLTVLSEDEYEDYLDSNLYPEPLDESHEEFNNRETVTKIEDAIKTDGQMDDGKIVMEIEAVAIEKEVVNDGVTKTDIPLVFWVICLSVVSFMTLLVIFGAAFVIFKIKNMKNVTGDIETGGGANVYERPSTKRHSRIETPWSFYPSSTQLKTFRNHSLLHTSENTSNTSNTSSCDYDYASSDYFLLSKAPSENSSKKYIFQSNHYASSNIKS